MKMGFINFVIFLSFLGLISMGINEIGVNVRNNSDFTQVMPSQNINPIFTGKSQMPNLNIKILRVTKVNKRMEKPAFESTRAADYREAGDRPQGGDIVNVEGDGEDDGDREESVKVKHMATFPPFSEPTCLKEVSEQEESVENDKTITEDDESASKSPSPEPEKDKSSADIDLNWDPKYDNNLGKDLVACISIFRGDVGVTPKNTSTPGITITTTGPLQLTLVKDTGSPFRKPGERTGGQGSASARILKTRSKKPVVQLQWLKEVVLKIVTLTKTVKNKDGKVEVINQFGTNRNHSFGWLCDESFVDKTVEAARKLKLTPHSEFKPNKDTFLHLATIGELYEADQDEIKEIENISAGDGDRAKFYRGMLTQMIGKMVAAGVMPGLKDSETVGDILIGTDNFWSKFASSFFGVIGSCLQTQAIQRKYILQLKKTMKEMAVVTSAFDDVIWQIDDLEEAKTMRDEVKDKGDPWIDLLFKVGVALLDGWREKVVNDSAVVELGAMLDFWIVDPGAGVETKTDPVLDNSDSTVIFIATDVEDVDKLVKRWGNKLIKIFERTEQLVETYETRARNEANIETPDTNFSPIPGHEELNYLSICQEIGVLDIDKPGSNNDVHVVFETINVSTQKQQESSEPHLRDRQHNKLLDAVTKTIVKRTAPPPPAAADASDDNIDLRPSYLRGGETRGLSRLAHSATAGSRGGQGGPPRGDDVPTRGGGGPGRGGPPGQGDGPGRGSGPGRGDGPGRGSGPGRGDDGPGGDPEHGGGPGRGRREGPPGGGDDPPPNNFSMNSDKERNLAARIQSKIQTINDIIDTIPSTDELNNSMQKSEMINTIALVQACQESIKSVSSIQSKLDELGGEPPRVTWKGENVSSEDWIAQANIEMSLKRQLAEAAKKTSETTEKLVSDEVLKKVGSAKLPVLDASWKGLTFLQKLAGLFDSEDIRRTAESSTGFAEYLRSHLRGKDLEKTKHMVWGHEVTTALMETYTSGGWGVDLVFEEMIYLLKAPVEAQGKGHRHQAMQTNLNAAYVQLVAIYDLELAHFVTETNIAVTVSVCTDDEFSGKWEALLLKFNKSDDLEREAILSNPELDLNDSALGVPASGRSGTANLSVLQRRPLCRGFDKPSTRIDMTTCREQLSTTEQQFSLLMLFMENSVRTLEAIRIKELKTAIALKRANNGAVVGGGKPWSSNNKPWNGKNYNNHKPDNNNHVNNLNDHTLDGSEDTAGAAGDSLNNIGEGPKPKRRKTAPCKMLCVNSPGWRGYKCQEGLPGPGSCYFCETMQEATPKKRASLVTSVVLCGRCLQNGDPATGGHLQADCKSTHRCKECGGDHNTLLHEVWGDQSVKTGHTTNNIDRDEDLMDGSGFTEDLIDAVNNIGDDGEDAFDCGWVHAIKADPTAMEMFKKLISKVIPKTNIIEYDSWDQDKKDSYKKAYENLKRSITAAKREAAGAMDSVNNISDPGSLDIFNDFLRTAKLLDIAHESALKVTQEVDKTESESLSFSRIDEIAVRGQTFSRQTVENICQKNAVIISHLTENKSTSFFEPKLSVNKSETQTKLMRAETLIHRLSSKTFLNFVPVDVLVEDPSPEVISALQSIPDVIIGYRNDRCYARCLCLHDPGSTLNVVTTKFGTAIKARAVVKGEMPLTTVSGNACPNNMYLLQLQAGSFLHNLAVVMLERFSPATGLSCLDVGLLEMLMGIDTTTAQNINLPEKTKDCHILLGNGDSDLNILRIWDPRSVGLKPLLFSRDIQLFYCRFSVDKKVIVSGRFGTPQYLCDKTLDNENFPRFLIPNDHEEDVGLKLDKMLWMMEKPQRVLDASSLVTKRLRAMNDLDIEADSVRSWANINHIMAGLMEEDHTITVEHGGSHMFTVNNISPGATKMLLDYLAGEAALLNPEILCKNHKKLANQLLKECPNCAPLNMSLDEMTQQMRYLELWDKVNLEQNEDGSYRIVVTVPFSQPLETIGKKKNMNLKQAEQATRRLFDKAEDLDSLDIIHGQIRDKIFVKHLSIIPEEDMAKIEKGLIFAQTILRNQVFNLSSSSSPLRLICNTASSIPFSDSSLTKADTCPKYDLVSLLNMGVRATLAPIFSSLDLKGAYLSMHTCPKTRYMYITVWLMDPAARTGVVLLASERIDFGFSSASILLRIALVKLGIPVLDLDISKATIRDSTYVDNLNVDRAQTPAEMAKCIVDLKVNLGKLNLVVDKLYTPRWLWDMEEMKEVRELYNNDFKPVTNSLGLVWDLEKDEFTPNTNLTIFDNYRGMPGGPSLKDTDLDKDEMTRDGMCRVVPQVWDQIGKYHGPNIASAKLLLSKVCKAVPMTAMKDPIRIHDQELGDMCKTFFRRLANTDIIPTPRVCLKEGYKITVVYVDHDASHMAVAAVILVLSENAQGDKDCHLIMAKSIISNNTVISNEVRSHACGAMLLVTFVTAIKPLVDTHGFKFEVVCITDNAPSSYIFKNENKGVLNRNTRNIVLRSLVTMQDLVPGTRVTMSWVPSALMTSEFCTKIYMNAPDICNSSRWRHGHPLLKIPSLIKHFWFVKCEDNKIKYRDLPVLDVKDDFMDTVEANPIRDEDSHIIIFDENDNKLEETFPVNQDVVNNITGEDDDNQDKPMSVDDFISIVLDSEESFKQDDHLTFLSMCELEDHAGMHNDKENAAEVYRHSYVYHISSEEDVKFTEANMSLAGQEAVFTQADFEYGFMDLQVDNILVGEVAPEPMSKDVYDKIMDVSNDVVKIINFVINIKDIKENPEIHPSVERSPRSVWSLLVASDQTHYGISKDNKHLSTIVNGFVTIPLKLEGVTLPFLDNSGPLLHKVIMTHHKERTGQGWMDVTHIGLSKLRSKLNNCQYGIWCFSADREIKKVLDQCGHCLRSQLKKFKIKSGSRYVMTNPEVQLFHEASGDPIGPLCIRQWKSARRATLMCYLLLLVCHHTSAVVIQILGDLQSESVILGLLTIERRLNVSLKHLWFDKGSSLSAKLLQHPSRQWIVHQHAATAHHRLFSERKIADFRRIYNKIMKKFSHENKAAVPLNIYQLLFLASNIQLTINSVPYGKGSKMCPAMLLHARGLVNEFVHGMEELNIPSQYSMDTVNNWVEGMREFRYELLAEVMNRQDVLSESTQDVYTPYFGDIVLARLGSGDIGESNVVTVSTHNKDTHRHPDAPKVSSRSVIIANQRGYERIFPTENLSLIVEGSGRRQNKNTEAHNHDLSKFLGILFQNTFLNSYLIFLQTQPNNDCKIPSVLHSYDSYPLYFPTPCLSVHFSSVSACQLSEGAPSLRSQKMGGWFSSFGSGQVKVEAAFSSDKYLHPGKDGSSVYFDWYGYVQSLTLPQTLKHLLTPTCMFMTSYICRVNGVYEPSMRALESVTNHLREATSDSFVFTAVGLGITWAILVVLVALRYVYGCKLAKEHKDAESGFAPRAPGVQFRQYPAPHIEMPGGSGQDIGAQTMRRTSVTEPVPGIKIKVETDNG